MNYLVGAQLLSVAVVAFLTGHYIGYIRGLRHARRRPITVADFTRLSRGE